jgi:ATP adenylyltransferase
MIFEKLSAFIKKKMRMSHIYQPVILIALLKNKGKCSEEEIAKDLLSYDQSQIEYYTKVTNNMVGRILRHHQIIEKDSRTKAYNLIGFEDLTASQTEDLISLCQEKLMAFLEARGKNIFDHRRKSIGYISGTIKYEVLKRAKFHCELCGIPADEKALEVDHIIPKNKGGIDGLINYQALCYSCNAMKRDRDSTDFHEIRESFKYRKENCHFCLITPSRIIGENNLAYVIRDKYPVTDLHTLIIPKRHVTGYFDLGQAEINACNGLINQYKEEIISIDHTVGGFNIGVNVGEAAGQTIFHCHIHLIPRRKGDVPNPRGGIRHTIPGKGFYYQ